MKEISVANHKVTIWDSVEEMPIVRWNKMQKFLMIEGAAGGGIEGLVARLNKINALMKEEKHEKRVNAEVMDIIQGIRFAESGINPKSMAFACLVASIDERMCNDISDEGLRSTSILLENISKAEQDAIVDGVKKKFKPSWRHIFHRGKQTTETR